MVLDEDDKIDKLDIQINVKNSDGYEYQLLWIDR